MNTELAQRLSQITNDFYRRFYQSFSESRQAAWPGWQQSLQILTEQGLPVSGPLAVLDLACGNLRWLRFLSEQLPEAAIAYYGLDNCPALVVEAASGSEQPRLHADWHFQEVDILSELFAGGDLSTFSPGTPPDLAVCFGFMHHLPLPEQRQTVLNWLVQQVGAGGWLVLTFWRFLNDAKLAARVRQLQSTAYQELGLPELPENDYLLGWQNLPGVWRYCHNFPDAEIDSLVAGLGCAASEIARFQADGRGGNLNTYLILRAG